MTDEHSDRRKERWIAVASVAARQWGCITTAQLRHVGVTPPVIARWASEHRLHRLLRGVYAVGHRSPAPEQRWQAALLGYGVDATLSRFVSIALHGLGPPPGTTTIVMPRWVRAQQGVRPHVSSVPLDSDEVVIRKGLRTTSIERTLLDLAASCEPIERLVAEATAKRLTNVARLQTYAERRAGARGATRLRGCIEGSHARSKLEAEFAAWLRRRGLPQPRFNEPFGPYSLDAVWPAAGLVVEVDAYETHGTRYSFEADRRRDAYTAARGLRTIRVTPGRWRDDGDRLARDLRSALDCVRRTFQPLEGS